MIIMCIILITITIILILTILYINAFNKVNTIQTKIKTSEEKIINALKEKQELMEQLYIQIKKVIKKKDYLKEFNLLKSKKLSSYELDKELNNHLETMLNFKEDYKELNNDKFNETLMNINEIDQKIMANKKFFNNNNNQLIKVLKGHIRLIAKLNKITIKNSYEIKEPNKD